MTSPKDSKTNLFGGSAESIIAPYLSVELQEDDYTAVVAPIKNWNLLDVRAVYSLLKEDYDRRVFMVLEDSRSIEIEPVQESPETSTQSIQTAPEVNAPQEELLWGSRQVAAVIDEERPMAHFVLDADIYALTLHEFASSYCTNVTVLRVPGGWIYSRYHRGANQIAETFVPYTSYNAASAPPNTLALDGGEK